MGFYKGHQIIFIGFNTDAEPSFIVRKRGSDEILATADTVSLAIETIDVLLSQQAIPYFTKEDVEKAMTDLRALS